MHPPRGAQQHGGSLQVVKSLETGKSFTTDLRDQENAPRGLNVSRKVR